MPNSKRRVPTLTPQVAFWITAAAFFTLMSFTTLPTPLYGLYEQRDRFPTVVVTAIFAMYSFGVIVSLLLAGHVSDWVGRRRMMLVSAALLFVSAIMFVLFHGVVLLLVARFVSGLGVGTLTATATAALGELRARAGGSPTLATTLAGVANLGGLAIGPLIAGVLSVVAPSPLVVSYAVYVVLIALAALAIAFVPETVSPPRERVRWHPQRITVPRENRAPYWAAGVGAFAAFAISAFFGAVAPTFLATSIGDRSRVLAGFAAFAVLASAAVAQVVFARVAVRRQLLTGVVSMVAGMVAIGVGDVSRGLALFLGGGVIAGIGVGLVFRGALTAAGGLAEEGQQGQVLAGIFLLAYVGLTIPPLLIGVALIWLPLIWVALAFAGLIIVLILASGPLLLRQMGDRAGE
ncbi:MFS transporter [Curtobacterium ammoniigenes]|uniref:MFS transporter n=1 Tax=Curtobacterium ammoniigenes TaxID=395387 RepID=UPI0012EE47FC|nr:MFS transporter [Curtobacterium ammoniigenes]